MSGALVAVLLLGTAAEPPTPAPAHPEKDAARPAPANPPPQQHKKRRMAPPPPRQQPAPKDPENAKTAMA